MDIWPPYETIDRDRYTHIIVRRITDYRLKILKRIHLFIAILKLHLFVPSSSLKFLYLFQFKFMRISRTIRYRETRTNDDQTYIRITENFSLRSYKSRTKI